MVNWSLDFFIGMHNWEWCKFRWSGKGSRETTCQAKERTLPHISQGWHNLVSEKEDIIFIAVLESRVWIETPCTKVCKIPGVVGILACLRIAASKTRLKEVKKVAKEIVA